MHCTSTIKALNARAQAEYDDKHGAPVEDDSPIELETPARVFIGGVEQPTVVRAKPSVDEWYAELVGA